MLLAAKALEFERAASLRDRIDEIRALAGEAERLGVGAGAARTGPDAAEIRLRRVRRRPPSSRIGRASRAASSAGSARTGSERSCPRSTAVPPSASIWRCSKRSHFRWSSSPCPKTSAPATSPRSTRFARGSRRARGDRRQTAGRGRRHRDRPTHVPRGRSQPQVPAAGRRTARRSPPGRPCAQVIGDAGSILKAERTALNFLQRLSGVATLTRRYVDAVAGTGAVILDTRKTTPGLRFLEKYAVQCGGGQNHRLALWDMYLVKDNHIRAAGGITAALDRIAAHAAGRPAARGRGRVARPAARGAAPRGRPHPARQPDASRR